MPILPGVIKVKNLSMGLFIPSLTIGAREIIYVILNQIAATERIFIVLHLRGLCRLYQLGSF